MCITPDAVDAAKLYTVSEVANILRFKPDWVRRHFAAVNGVIHCGSSRRGRRRYDPLLIPGSVLLGWIAIRSIPSK
jgi:hypothetical protein